MLALRSALRCTWHLFARVAMEYSVRSVDFEHAAVALSQSTPFPYEYHCLFVSYERRMQIRVSALGSI